jgi:uncharacterized protein YecT (DUF1311 family)
MKHLILPLMIFFGLSLSAQDALINPSLFEINSFRMNEAQTQTDLNQYAAEELERADRILNMVYQQIIMAYADDELFTERLRIAQRNWIAYRDSHLEAVLPVPPGENPRTYWGSMYPMTRDLKLAELTWDRVKELYLWLDADEGQHGSYRY